MIATLCRGLRVYTEDLLEQQCLLQRTLQAEQKRMAAYTSLVEQHGAGAREAVGALQTALQQARASSLTCEGQEHASMWHAPCMHCLHSADA